MIASGALRIHCDHFLDCDWGRDIVALQCPERHIGVQPKLDLAQNPPVGVAVQCEDDHGTRYIVVEATVAQVVWVVLQLK